MAEKKEGFFKRIFRFGKKADDAAEIEAQQAAELNAELDAADEVAKAEAAQKVTAEKAAEKATKAAETKAKKAKDAADKKSDKALKAKLDKAAKAEKSAQDAADKKQAAKELKAADKAEKAERAAAEKAQVVAAKEAAAAEKQAQEEAARLEAEETERLEAAQRLALAEEQQAAAEKAKAEQEIAAEPQADEPSEKKSWFSRLKTGLSRSSANLTENITAVFTKKKLDEDTLQELEDILIQADLGVETALKVTEKLASQRMGKDVTDEEVREFMADEIEQVLKPVAAELELDLDHTPHVILVVGVNGSGKTTTIGKLSQKLYDAGFSTLLVAGDTFRAAAIEQLKIWGDRTLSPVVSRPLGSDAAGLAFDAYQQCVDENRDVMLMDTAGRLQNKTELMDELEKIIRVLKKQDPSAPHTVLLTLDATTGQNAMNQVDIFKEVSGVNGLVMTKLDGTARGGILVAISAKHKLPIYFVGVGETVDDLEPFEAREFARTIAGLDLDAAE